MANYTVFSKLDLRKGYYQISVRKSDRGKTAFTTPNGKYEWNKIPLGLKNSPKYFHNVIARTSEGVSNVTVFVDDILIYSKTKEEHISTFKQVLKKLDKKNIIINEEKNSLGKEQIKYLGFVISSKGYHSDPERL
ncbi:pol polyprotein [Pseudoloma neurophilia]|uniref:Pol polyprotein n=1 Tax=Pseudoloma neurophilia TaxID=146866 RepID=A0A0R0M5C4_9MICR|nr:pol polyprotein [Pseudoloma neurophilia]